MDEGIAVGVFGATGAVGSEVIKLLQSENWPIDQIRLYGSERSAGKKVFWRNTEIPIQVFSEDEAPHLDLAFLAASSEVAKDIAPVLANKGTYVIDNSSAFRMDAGVPLIVPEINFDAFAPENRIVANPNCSTIILLMAVAPLRELGKINRIIVSTYQSASGAGREAMVELEESTGAYLRGEEFEPKIMPYPYAFNLFSHNTEVGADGYNGEETKVIMETRKILNNPDMLVNPTCIRVPVLRSHSESITVEFDDDAPSVDRIQECLKAFPGIQLIDDRIGNRFPMPIDSNGQHDVFVGRIRQDVSNPRAIAMFVCGDQLLKGAALNAVQIGARIFGIDKA